MVFWSKDDTPFEQEDPKINIFQVSQTTSSTWRTTFCPKSISSTRLSSSSRSKTRWESGRRCCCPGEATNVRFFRCCKNAETTVISIFFHSQVVVHRAALQGQRPGKVGRPDPHRVHQAAGGLRAALLRRHSGLDNSCLVTTRERASINILLEFNT